MSTHCENVFRVNWSVVSGKLFKFFFRNYRLCCTTSATDTHGRRKEKQGHAIMTHEAYTEENWRKMVIGIGSEINEISLVLVIGKNHVIKQTVGSVSRLRTTSNIFRKRFTA